ncbi:MAG: HXXEE domain-containing protein [Burkholderiales bacterium]
MQRGLSSLVILVSCLGLFAPLGQQAWLHANWMNLGLAGAGFAMLGALAFRDPATSWWRDTRSLNLLMVIAYLIHQFEEHGIDATGAHYAFMAVANSQIGGLVGCAPQSECPLNAENIFYVNTILVWLFLLAVMLVDNRRHVFANLCAPALLLVNALAHLQAVAVHGAYNPGVLTAIALFIPLSLHRYRVMLRDEGVGYGWLTASLVWAILGHALLLGFAALTYVKEILPIASYPLAMGAWALLPFLIRFAIRQKLDD